VPAARQAPPPATQSFNQRGSRNTWTIRSRRVPSRFVVSPNDVEHAVTLIEWRSLAVASRAPLLALVDKATSATPPPTFEAFADPVRHSCALPSSTNSGHNGRKPVNGYEFEGTPLAEFSLNEDEQKLARQLAVFYDKHGKLVQISDVPIYEDLGAQKVVDMFARFDRYELLHLKHRMAGEIDPRILEVVHQIDNPPSPPPKDYWKETEIWFKSKWWSVPVFILLSTIAVLGGLLSIVKTIFDLLN
jgi:hypothetical protein